MTDLATRIADVKKKAEALQKCHVSEAEAYRMAFRFSVAEPDLFLPMAARIEELEKALEPFAKEGEKSYPGEKDTWRIHSEINIGHLRTAARALNKETLK
jgi:hypothetical protein